MALITDWKMRCLICMKDVPAEIPVFGSQGQRKNLRRMMSEYLNLTAREHENEPKNICERCYDTLQRINDLKGCAQENKHNILLLRTLQRQDSEDRRAEVIRLWLGSQRMQQSDMSVSREHYSSGHPQQQQQQQPPQQQQPQPPQEQQQQQPQPPQQQQQQPQQPQQQQQQQQQPQPPQQQQQQQPQPPQQQQQPQSDFTCSSSSSSSSRMSTNEARGSIALNISAAVSENSDALNHTQSVSSTAARQGTSQRVLHHRGRKRHGTPLPFSTPSSRSCSPQPGALPPESSRKPYRSAARSLKARSKIAEQRNGEHSGSPQPGSLPPESAGKSSASRKRSATLQAKGNNAVSQESALMTKPQEKVEFHRAQSCSPIRGNSVSTSGEKRRRGRPRSKSLPPSKRRKLFDQAEPDYNETASKPTHWKPYLDDDICCGKITSSCDLKEFKKHIPFVKLQRVDVSATTTTTATATTTKKKIPWFQFPASQRSRKCEFTLVEDVLQGGIMQQFCWICNKTFPSIENMEEHLDEHVPKNRPGSSSSQDMTKPSSTATTPSFFACNLCQTQFSSNGFLQRHMINHSQKKWSHKCTVCEETFQTSAILKRHMGNHNISEQVSTSTEDPTCHQEEEQEQVYACSCCLQEFTSEQALGKHMVQHRRCTLCNKTFTGKDELATHVGECHKVCSICDETVADEEELQAHIDTSHEKCNLCGEQFLFEEELSAHLKKHPYPCVMCLSAFNDKAQRIEHMKLSHQDMIELLKETMAKEKITV